jgi:hypothetical protein
MFLDANKKGTVVGPIAIQDPITVDTVGPGNVSSVTVTASLDLEGPIGFHGHATISWPAVTGNGIRGYRIRWREVATPAIPYSYVDSPGTGVTYHLSGLGVGLTYEFAVATYDEYNNTSTQYVAGNNVTIQYLQSVQGQPYVILFYQNQFVVRPVPDQAYTIEITAYRRPSQALLGTTSNTAPVLTGRPEQLDWWELIAFGVAKKLYQDVLLNYPGSLYAVEARKRYRKMRGDGLN